MILLKGDVLSRRNTETGVFIDIVMEDRRNATAISNVHVHAIFVDCDAAGFPAAVRVAGAGFPAGVDEGRQPRA